MSGEFSNLASKSIVRQILSFFAYHASVNALFIGLVPFGEHFAFAMFRNASGRCSLVAPIEDCRFGDQLAPLARFFLLNLTASISLTFVYAFFILGYKTVLKIMPCVILSVFTIMICCLVLETSKTLAVFDTEELGVANIIHFMLTAVILGTVHGSFSHFMMKQEFLARYGDARRSKRPA